MNKSKYVLALLALMASGTIALAAPQGFHAGSGQAGALSVATGGNAIWDNGTPVDSSISSQLDNVYPFDSQAADDFRLSDQNTLAAGQFIVTGVEWYGNYWNNSAEDNQTQGFNVLFYADNNGKPTGGPSNPSVTALLSNFVPFASSNEQLDGGGFYSYDAVLTIPFLAELHTRYWLAIQAVLPFTPQWGWAATDESLGGTVLGNGMQTGFPLLGSDYWTPSSAITGGQDLDAAFVLNGQLVPEPATVVLLGLGVFGVVRRRK